MSKYKIDIRAYSQEQKVKETGFSTTYIVKDKKTTNNYIAKVIIINDEEEDFTPKSIETSIKNLMHLQHPTLVKYIGYSLIDFPGNNNLTILMKYYQRGPLSKFIKNSQNGFPDNDYDSTTRQIILIGISRGMMYLHQHNVAHYNLTPENILLDKHLHPRITDSTIKEIQKPVEKTNSIIYVAPEIIEKNGFNLKADVYSFGMIMYEVVTQLDPFPELNSKKANIEKFIQKVVDSNYRPQIDDNVPESLKKLIDLCLSKDPKERPTFEELFKKLAYNISCENDEEESNYFIDENVDENAILLYIDKIAGNDTIYGEGSSPKSENKSQTYKVESEEEKMISAFYNHRSFPLLLMSTQSDMITSTNLEFDDFLILTVRSYNEKFDINNDKFISTLKTVFNGQNDLLKTRSFLLLFVFKNAVEIFPFYSFIMKNFNSKDIENILFNSIFFDELARHPVLMLDVVESIFHFINDCNYQYENICPYMVKLIQTNENSLVPIPPEKLNFLNEDKINKKSLAIIKEKYPQILPFSIRYSEYLNKTDSKVDDAKIFDVLCKIGLKKNEIEQHKNMKELIDFAFCEIMKPNFDFFILRNNFYWFKYHQKVTTELLNKYKSIGILFGLAIKKKIMIPIRFPSYFYKKLQKRILCYSDLKLYDPNFFGSIILLLKTELTEDSYMDFTYNDPFEKIEVDLMKLVDITDDIDFNVTPLLDSNKNNYLNRVIEWISKATDKEFNAFVDGFESEKVPPLFLKSFRLDEIDRIVSGEYIKNWDDFKNEAKYEGFDKDCRTIAWFWKFFFDLIEEKKLKILKFITGSSAIPIGGLKNIHITINRIDGDLPVAHTEINKIDLPEFDTFRKLKDKITTTILNK